MLSSDVNNFIYIGIIIVGTVAMTLSCIMNIKVKDAGQRGLELFFITMFVYVVSDFVAYYFLCNDTSPKAIFALIMVSDIMSILTITTWQYLLFLMAGIKKRGAYIFLMVFTVAYTLFAEGISAVFGSYDDGSIQLGSSFVRGFIEGSSIVYGIVFIGMGISCLVRILRQEKGFKNTVDIIFAVTFLAYMVWIQYWDFTVWYNSSGSLSEHYGADPVLLIYVILSLIFCIYFMKQDPLKITETELTKEDAVNYAVEHYSLSNREEEVLSLVFEGKSNQDIAEELFISENTVKRHINSILKKTEAKNRHELIFKIRNPKKRP